MIANASTMPEPGKMKRSQVLAGAILVQLILGTVYGYSIFWEPLLLSRCPKFQLLLISFLINPKVQQEFYWYTGIPCHSESEFMPCL